MTPLTKLIIGTSLFLVVAGGTGFYFSRNKAAAPETSTSGSLFPSSDGQGIAGGSQRTPSGGFVSSPAGPAGQPGESVLLFKKLTQNAVAGYTPTGSAEKPAVRYTLKENGHIFDTNLEQPEPSRVSNTTLARIYDALWNKAGTFTFLRYFKDANVSQSVGFSLAASSSTQEAVLSNRAFPTTIAQAILSPSQNSIFYLEPVGSGVRGVTATTNNTKSKTVFESPLAEWLISWPSESLITVQTKPAAGFPGYLYGINPANGAQERLLGDIPGLTTLVSPDKKKILYSIGSGNTLQTYLYTVATGETELFAADVLPEKCVWSAKDLTVVYCAVSATLPTAAYPDAWYKGLFHFTDDIWRIYTTSNEAEILLDAREDAQTLVDAVHLKLDASEESLYFINKRDGTLWYVRTQ